MHLGRDLWHNTCTEGYYLGIRLEFAVEVTLEISTDRIQSDPHSSLWCFCSWSGVQTMCLGEIIQVALTA